MRTSTKLLWAAVSAALSFGCFEGNEDNLDGGVIDAAGPCSDGEERSCFVEEGCTGTQVCSGGAFGDCAAPAEICDGLDNDCDGVVDNGFAGLGDACEGGQGKCIDRGVNVCSDDGQSVVCDAQPGDMTAEVCDGIDNDCDGMVDDEVEVGIECDTGRLGVCGVGQTTCEDGDTRCVAVTDPSDEVCDGLDNDCDGKVDEGDAGGALAEPCYDGPDGTDGVGPCVAGVRFCTDGAFGECAEQVVPGAEICDGVDNDCNGAVDDTEAECVCAAGETAPCYSGAAGTEGVGACVAGTQTCLEDGSGFGACEGEVVPGVELCDGVDNDCNGDIDDALGVGQPCVSGAGACEGAGVRVCDQETGQVVCDAVVGVPGDEVCDGTDNDCDGMVDDVDGVGTPCAVGEGACLARGLTVCGEGGLECGAVAGEPGDEICDGVDNDCNGAVDDVSGVGDTCTVGIGVCRSTGVMVCSPDGVVCGATEQPAERAEFCGNRADDDCDGETDEPDCIVPCDVDDNCPIDMICNDGTCEPGNCRIDDDCGPAGLCEDSFCIPGDCRVDEDCVDGEICDANFCVVFPDVCVETPVIDTFGVTEGSTAGAPSQVTASCGSGARSAENAYDLTLGYDGTICVDTFGSAYDTVLYARGECARGSTEIVCNDDARGGFGQSQIELEVTADGDYTVFVDGFGANNSGDYVLTVREGSCAACADDRDCPDDEVCAPQGDGGGLCAPPGCGDGVRDFGEACDDGRNDSGDGCSARCEIEEGFDCIEAPAEIAPVAVDIDGRVNCGPTPDNASPIDVPAWPAYRLYYAGGFVQISADGRKTFGISIAVDGEVAATTPSLGVAQDEAGVAALYGGFASDLFGVPEGSAVGAFFRDNPCADNGGTLNGEVRAVDFCYPTTCLADEDCLFGLVCVDGECVEPPDSDGDGVPDLRDVDDDNDGIPDALECFEAGQAQTSLINGGFEEPPLAAGTNRQTPEANVPGWETTEGPGSIEMWGSGFLGVPAAVGNAFAEINAFEADGALYQDIATVPGTVFTWSFYHRGRSGEDELELRAGPPDATVTIANAVTGNDAWRRYTGTYVVPEGQELTRFEFRSIRSTGGAGIGNFVDGVEFLPTCPPDADADGDGIPNSLDLDSDGDGVPDAEEAGHGLPHTGGRVDGPVGGNGLVDGAETVPDSGIIDYVLRDRDDNGIYDFLEPGPYDCGNGALDEGEECEDGNRDNGDGCDENCAVEPNWECVFSDEAGVGPCADGDPADTVSVTPGDLLPAIGGNGGGPFDDTCPPGEVVIGFDLSIGRWGGFPGVDFITQSQAQCASFDVVDGAVALTPTILTPRRGNTNNPVTSTRCPEDHVVTGYVGYDAGGAQRYVAGLALVCSPVAVVDGRIEIGEAIVIEAVGNLSNQVGRFDCAENQLVGANVGRSGDIIDRFAMRCDNVVEACRVEAGSVCEFQGECLADADCEDGQLCRGQVCIDTGVCPDDDAFEPNDDVENAAEVMEGRYEDLAVCGNVDWYTIELCAGGTLTVDVYFVDDDGDIDVAIQDGPASTSVTNDERVVLANAGGPRTVNWQVYGFQGALNGYAMDVTVTGCLEACPDGRFPAECPEGFTAVDGNTCELQAQEPAVPNGEFLDVCRGPTNGSYGANGVLLPGGRVIGGGFFGDGSNGSRLNTAGVWACGPDGQTAAPEPINEQIGFASCFQLDAPGEYVIGLGGDDNMVASVDGQEIFRQNGAFQSWYMVPAVLTGGTHIITLEGINTGGPGVLGAEIYGPFPPGSTASDDALAGLDYANNVAFSSLSQIGGQFNTGVNSGYSCPEGLALDLCGGEPQCTRFERLDRCELAAVFCGNGEVDDGEECDDGNFDDGDGCSSACVVEGEFVCREEGFGIGVTDAVPWDGAPEPAWTVSPDGRTVVQNANAQPAHYSTSLPISANYRAVLNVSVQTAADDDIVGWTVGAGETPFTNPAGPYLLFSWKQADQNNPDDLGLATAGLRVGLVDGVVDENEVWQFNGPITRLADGNRFGAVGWEDGRVYTVEITGDADRLQVYVDGELEFDLDGPLPTGNLGFYTFSQDLYTAELVAPLTLQVCELLPDEICDNGEDEDGDGLVDCDDRDCNLDPACAITRTVYFSAPASTAEVPGAPTRLYTVDSEGAVQLLGDVLLDGEPIRVSALALAPDGQLWGFEFLPGGIGEPGTSRLILIDPDTATAMVMDEGTETYIDGAAFDPDGDLWVTDATNQQVRGYDLELGIGPSVLEYPIGFLGSDITFDADGNCYLTGVAENFNQFPIYTCDLVAGTAESLGEPPTGPGFDSNDSTIPAMAFAYDDITCEQRLYAFDSLAIDELGYLDLTTDPPTMTHIESTGINYSYYTTPDMGGFPSVANAPDCAGRIERCANAVDDNGDGLADCDDPLCANNPACLGDGPRAGDVRLVSAEGPHTGRLEVFANGEWGTVCDDNWDGDFGAPIEQRQINGDVACRQLGYAGMAAYFDAVPGVGPILLDNVRCVGDEGRLIDCPANAIGVNNCGHAEDVGLTCLLPGECLDETHCAPGEACVDGACGVVGAVEAICDDGADDDDDGLIDCGDDDCRDDPACAIERVVYFSMPAHTVGNNARPNSPSRLYALDSAGSAVYIGEIDVDGQPAAISAIALSPGGVLSGFAVDPDAQTSTPIEIDPATGDATATGPSVPVWIHGAGYGPDGTLYVMDRTNQQVRTFADGLGARVLDYPIPMDGGDIAFDADGNCFLTGTFIAGEQQRDVYRCDVVAGTTTSLGAPQPQGFEDGGGRILASSLAFALNDRTCASELYTLDGYFIDELGVIDVGVEPPVMQQVASTGLNYTYFIQPDAAGFPNGINSPACQAGSETLCADGIDDDGDGDTDCEDNDCIGEPTCVIAPVACEEPIDAIVGPGTYRGTTAGTGNDHEPSCQPTDSQEAVLSFFAARTATWCLDTAGTAFDTVLYVRETNCPDGDDLECDDDDGPGTQSMLEFRAIHGRTYYIFVDGFDGEAGDYILNAYRGACGVAEVCDDGIDNDDDGDADCADDECAGVAGCDPAPEPACGDGTVDELDGEQCDDGNIDDGDGCSSECQLEGGFACQQFDFGLGVEDVLPTPGDNNPSEWLVSGGGFIVTQNRNSQPAHYSTTLPISPTYTATIRVGVRTDSDNDGIGWTIGATDRPLTDWQRPYLLFYWRQGTQDDDVYGLGREGLRVARIDGPSTGPELNQLAGPNITELAEGINYGDERWQDNTNYLVELVGDGTRLQVYVDGRLEFDLADTGISGNLGFFSLSQTQFRAELVSPREIQICDEDPAAAPVDVAIAGFAMNPDPVVIDVGQTVRWTNMDASTHTVTSGVRGAPDSGELFDSNNIVSGGTFEFTFDTPGTYTYFCRPHAAMNGYEVIVLDPGACQEACDDGAACFGLPTGQDCVDECNANRANRVVAQCVAEALDPDAAQCDINAFALCGGGVP